MSRNKAHHRTGSVVTTAWRRARETAVRLQPAADKVKPLAKNARVAARQQAHRTRAWAAPQVEKAGQAVQHSIAPKVSALLSAAARQLEPEKPRPQRWRKVAGVSAATAAASAFAAAVRSRKKAGAAAAAADVEQPGDGLSADETTPAVKPQNGQRSRSSDVAQGSGARTS